VKSFNVAPFCLASMSAIGVSNVLASARANFSVIPGICNNWLANIIVRVSAGLSWGSILMHFSDGCIIAISARTGSRASLQNRTENHVHISYLDSILSVSDSKFDKYDRILS
jgi:hypothetical protein